MYRTESYNEPVYLPLTCPHCSITRTKKVRLNVRERSLGLVREASQYVTKVHCDNPTCNQDYYVDLNPGRRSVQKVLDRIPVLKRASNYFPIGEQKLNVSISPVAIPSPPLNAPARKPYLHIDEVYGDSLFTGDWSQTPQGVVAQPAAIQHAPAGAPPIAGIVAAPGVAPPANRNQAAIQHLQGLAALLQP